jgi:hypothetical protein
VGSLIEIMDAMADQIADAIGAEALNVQVEPRMVVNPTPPCIDIYPADEPRDAETAGFADLDGGYVFTVRARVNTADNEAGQDLLLAFMDDEDTLCVPAALLEDPTLGGASSSVHIDSGTGYVQYAAPSGEGAYLGAQWRVKVLKVEAVS